MDSIAYDGKKDVDPTSIKVESYKLTGDPRKAPEEPGSVLKMTCTRANLRAVGWENPDFKKPIVTIGVPFTNLNPCNNKFKELADIIAEEVEAQGGKAYLAFTPVISDGESQGSKAMRYSLISRDYIADCIEIMHEGACSDALITLGGCDKTVPGVVMPLARLNVVGLPFWRACASRKV